MKTLLALAAATATLFTFGSTDAQAGHSHGSCRVLSTCGQCRQPVYAYYRPVRYSNSCAVYGWVPSYHNHSSVSIRFGSSSTSRYNYGYSSPSLRIQNYSRSIRSYPHSRSYSRFSPSIRSRSYRSCR